MAATLQQGDVALFQTLADGDIVSVSGVVEMGGGLETSAFLSLFGGNADDTGGANDPANWWGNLSETQPARHYRSETQNIIRTLPLTTGNLRRIEAAAERDLAWMVEAGVASSVSVEATIPGLNRLDLAVAIDAVGEETELTFSTNWKIDGGVDVIGKEFIPGGESSFIQEYTLLESGDFLLLESGGRIEFEGDV